MVEGVLAKLDQEMNMEVRNASFYSDSENKVFLDKYMIKGSQVRYIRLPDDVNMDVLARN